MRKKVAPNPIQFPWRVPEAGFEVVTEKGERCLAARDDPARPGLVIAHPLYEETALFRRFAELPLKVTTKPDGLVALGQIDESAVIGFAKDFGDLGLSYQLRVPITRGKAPVTVAAGRLRWFAGEPLTYWAQEIFRTRILVELWDTLRGEDDLSRSKALKRVIHWSDDGVQYVGPWIDPWASQRIIADRGIHPETLATFKPGDLIAPGWRFLHTAINTELKNHALLAVLAGQDEARPYLAGPDEVRLYLTPESLIGALWYQFASAVAQNKRFQQCEQCGKWFQPGRDTHEDGRAVRADARFCRGTCRSKHYHAKKRTALELRAKGTSLREIAKKLNSDIQTVKGWVKK